MNNHPEWMKEREEPEKTDEAHPVTMPQIIEELDKYNVGANRKSLYEDLEALRLYGVDVI